MTIRNNNLAFGHKNRTTKAFGLPNTATADLPDSVAGQGSSGTTGMLVYDSTSGSLKYNNGSTWAELSTGGGTSHNVLSATHGDSAAGTVLRGDVVVGNSTPKWSRLAIGTANKYLRTDGTDAAWSPYTLALSGNVTTGGAV
ncbi:MAG: hypothetical protein QME51_10415, partial [Planctomycetota bacterium]|nr:hypothetical protein [Planctomycetota bacterium]